MGQRSISVAELKAECVNLERDVLARGLATEADLAPNRPGKEKNVNRDARAWLRFYAVLHRHHGRGEHSGNEENRMRADSQVLSALRDEPIRVNLIQPVPLEDARAKKGESETDTLLVYPKSLDALLHAHALDRQLGWLIIQKERAEDAGARGMPRASELHERIIDAMAYTYGLLAWIMTSPGPQMPYEATVRGDPELPKYIKALHPMDVAQIVAASREHHGRLAALQVLIDRRTQAEGGRRPSWSQFIGSLAVEMDTDSVQISCYRSLGSLLASVRLDADAKAMPEKDSDAADASHPSTGNLG
jgi:hypothetical protein